MNVKALRDLQATHETIKELRKNRSILFSQLCETQTAQFIFSSVLYSPDRIKEYLEVLFYAAGDGLISVEKSGDDWLISL